MPERTAHTPAIPSPASQCGGSRLEILVVDPDDQRSVQLTEELGADLLVRCAERPSGRAALTSYARARFDAVILRRELGDTDCWRWIRMVRSGRFGFAATPIIVLCTSVERDALVPTLDSYTQLALEDDLASLCTLLKHVQDDCHRQRVLIIEDAPEAAVATRRALLKYFRAEAAADGNEGLHLWRAGRHDLILLDLGLPGMSGEQVLAEVLREHPEQAIVVLTAHDAPEEYERLMLAGALDFLSKPIDLHALPELCSSILRQQACLTNADRIATREHAVAGLLRRMHAAHYHVERGQTAHAARHLRQAIFESRVGTLSDDDWAQLLGEFDPG